MRTTPRVIDHLPLPPVEMPVATPAVMVVSFLERCGVAGRVQQMMLWAWGDAGRPEWLEGER